MTERRDSQKGGTARKRTVLIARVLLTFAMLAATAPLIAQVDSSSQLVIRPGLLDDRGIRAVYRAILAQSDIAAWPLYRVQPGDELSQLVYDQYGVGGTEQSKTTAFLIDTIALANELSSKDKLRVGQTLRVPTLPQLFDRSRTSSTTTRLAIQDYRSEKLSNVRAQPNASRRTSLWVIHTPQSKVAALLRNVEDELGPGPDQVKFKAAALTSLTSQLFVASTVQEGTAGAAQASPNPPIPPVAVGTPAGRMFVLDFFHGECDHGWMVLDVISAELARLGVAALPPSSVVHFNIDSRDTTGQRQIVRAYVKRRLDNDADLMKMFMAVLDTAFGNAQKVVNPKGPSVSPLVVNAIMDSLLVDPTAWVITTSTTVFTPFIDWIASSTHRRNASLLFGASGEIDGHQPTQIKTITDFTTWQPQEEYLKDPSLPAFLVGGIDGSGPFGVVGNDPTQVPLVANADGWTGSCIRPKWKGTSFSTPSVAAIVFAAIATWRTKHDTDTTSARIVRRILLSGSVDSKLANTFAGGGPLDARKLELGKSAYGITNSNQLVALAYLDGVLYVPQAWALSPVDGAGLSFIGRDTYAFSVADGRWEKLGQVQSVDIRMKAPATICSATADGYCHYKSLDELRAAFREIGSLP